MSAHEQEKEKEKVYPRPSLTADVVVVALDSIGDMRVLFIRRKHEPFKGACAFPGGFCEPTETVAQAAVRELEEETGLTGVHVDELHSFTTPGRDPRGWVVSIAHLAVVDGSMIDAVKAGDDAADAVWPGLWLTESGGFLLTSVGVLAFDHDQILIAAVTRLRERLVALGLGPEQYTRAEALREAWPQLLARA